MEKSLEEAIQNYKSCYYIDDSETVDEHELFSFLCSNYKYLDIINYKLKNGFDINYKFGYKGETVFHYAVNYGNAGIVSLLIKNGADINAKSYLHNRMPIHYVKSLTVLKMLIKNGADITASDSKGYKPYDLHELFKSKRYFKLNGNKIKNMLHEFIKAGLDINKLDEGYHMIHSFSCRNYIAPIKLLIKYNVNINQPDPNNITPIQISNLFNIELSYLFAKHNAIIPKFDCINKPIKPKIIKIKLLSVLNSILSIRNVLIKNNIPNEIQIKISQYL